MLKDLLMSGGCEKKYKDARLAEGMMGLWQVLDAAQDAWDIKAFRPFYMHELKQNRKGTYSLAPLGKAIKWRLIVVCLDETGREIVPGSDEAVFLRGVKEFEVKELTDHYDD
jgi:plasmid maintenance system killer protein